MSLSERQNNPTANPLLVFREEFDDWAILFDPETGKGFGLNPVSAFIWKRLDGKHSEDDIVSELREEMENVPDDVTQHVRDFIDTLAGKGLVGYEADRND